MLIHLVVNTPNNHIQNAGNEDMFCSLEILLQDKKPNQTKDFYQDIDSLPVHVN